MLKKVSFKIFFLLLSINIICFSNLLAAQPETTTQKDDRVAAENNSQIDEAENLIKKKQKEELNKIIDEFIEEIKNKLKTIEERLEEIKTVEEYSKYPAIRLNVDTPLFGLTSITNSKLKIKQDVSATDIAKGYSIKNVVKNDSIKLPDLLIAGLIVSTKDVKFDENISLTDANTSVLKLMQYTTTVDNTIEFLDTQINKTFKGYIEKEKNDEIDEVNRRLSKLESSLLSSDSNLTKIYIISPDEKSKEIYNELVKKFQSISSGIKSNKKEIKNILLTKEELNKIQKNVLELENQMIDFTGSVESALKEKNANIEVTKMLAALEDELNVRKGSIEQYIKNSVEKREVKKESSQNTTENDPQNSDKTENTSNSETEKSNDSENNEVTIEEIKLYDVVSQTNLEAINNHIKEIITRKDKYIKLENEIIEKNNSSNSDTQTDNTENKDEQTKTEDKSENKTDENKNKLVISDEEKNTLIEDVLKIYKDCIVKENKFYLDNINNTLKNTTSKISDLSKYTESDVLNEMRYIYLTLPEKLDNYLESANMNSTIETNILTANFSKEYQMLLKTYIKISKIYDELNVTDIKNKD